MKLAFCLFKYFPYGGLQRDFLRIATACLQRGHSVQVYTMQWEGELPPGVQLTIVPVRGLSNHQRCWTFAQALPSHLQQAKPDVVIGFNKMPGLDIYYAADPCYVAKARSQHGAWYRLSRRYKIFAKLEQAVFSSVARTQIFLLAEREQAQFMRYYGTQAARFYLLPPGIAKDRQAPANIQEIRSALRQELHIGASDNVLLMIGSGFKTKGVDRALRALHSLPAEIKQQTHLLVIGQDDPQPFLSLARKLHIADRVRFLGGRDDVPRFLWSADLLVHPAYTENTGTVLLEATVAGLPVLTTAACGYASHIAKTQAGIVVPLPFQQHEFNRQLLLMLTSPCKQMWHNNALAYATNTDLYSLPERAVAFIEQFQV